MAANFEVDKEKSEPTTGAGAAPQMPTLKEGSTGLVVARLQNVLTNAAPGQWETTPGPIDEHFGPKTTKAVKAFQKFAGLKATGVVDDDVWAAALPSLSSTLASTVGVDVRPQLSTGP
ncbi:MAG TPA: peptidoglycan-binding domain-containing protein [Acidimicrobiales bacterium]|nr:peptidoglycan-binding domain-containing protein [Acidimicrobiales bacterium]